jgi:hypothetical protein
MKAHHRSAFLAGMLAPLLIASAAASAAPLRPAPDAKLAAKIDAYIRPFVESENFPGAILVARGEDILLSKAYGMANYELKVPNTPRQRFHLASLTKMFTAAAVLLLEEQGKLSTSDAVSKFLPDYPNGDKILLEQLRKPVRYTTCPALDFPTAKAGSLPRRNSSWRNSRPKPFDFRAGIETATAAPTTTCWPSSSRRSPGRRLRGVREGQHLDRLGMKSTLHDGDASALIDDRASGTVPTVSAG